MIPMEAVEAAAKKFASLLANTKWDHLGPLTQDAYRNQARAALEAAAPYMLIHVHHHDIEKHAESFNEGYETCMAQELADDPTTAQDWLDEKLAEARSAALLEAADALDKLWGERKDKPQNGQRDWADGVEESENLLRAHAANMLNTEGEK